MSTYDKRRATAVEAVVGSTADNTNLSCFVKIPPQRTCTIYGLDAFVDTAATSNCVIEVVRSDAATTALAEVAVDATGAAASSTTLPVTTTNTSSSDVFLRFRVGGAATGSGVAWVVCQHDIPGVS